jgi:hypothetical protein
VATRSRVRPEEEGTARRRGDIASSKSPRRNRIVRSEKVSATEMDGAFCQHGRSGFPRR